MENYKKTKQRELILNIFNEVNKPISSEEIHEIISKQIDNLALSTIYRNINLLVKKSIITKIYEDGIGKYILNINNHNHILECNKCHKQIQLNTCPFEIIEKTVLKDTGFTIDDNSQIIKGYCKLCK